MRKLVEIVSIWGACMVVAVALRVSLPRGHWMLFTWQGRGYSFMFQPGRVAFWICVTLGLAFVLVQLVKVMLRDLGLG